MTTLKEDLAALRIERAPQRDRRRRSRWLIWSGPAILAAVLGVAAWRWVSRDRPLEVQVATVTERAAGEPAAILNASGYVIARRRATISSKITGKVVEVNVEEGTEVRRGDVLARLDDAAPRAALALSMAQAEAARLGLRETEVRLTHARLIEQRTTRLSQQGVGAPSDVDQAKADADAIEARIAALRQQISVTERQIDVQRADLESTIIRAPFSGIAITKDAQPGEMVSPVSAGGGFTRTGICTIVDMKSLEVEVDVNESYINRVTSGQQVKATLDAYPDWQIPAHVITLVPAADRQKATILVRLGFTQLDPRILPDMAIKVRFLGPPDGVAVTRGSRPVTLIPRAAITSAGAEAVAFVVRGDTVERRVVSIGGPDGDRAQVLAGLQAGDRVVLSPSSQLTDGARVVIK